MQLPRRVFLHLAAGAATLQIVPQIARALDYPTRPVRWIVAYPAGGGTDIFARLMGQALSQRLGQQFVIENRAGAASNIGTEAVARAPADGYTLLESDMAAAINATLYDKLNFNSSATLLSLASSAHLFSCWCIHPFPPKRSPSS
jgi:tripartite-type tricarboxylate transporter receptor subunit TctC